jgi:hypothetical protein
MSLISLLMSVITPVVATLEKPVRRGGVSRWQFFAQNGAHYAVSSQGKRIDCTDIKDMRRLYARMMTYGFYAA